jgi:hypothetical protein
LLSGIFAGIFSRRRGEIGESAKGKTGKQAERKGEEADGAPKEEGRLEEGHCRSCNITVGVGQRIPAELS